MRILVVDDIAINRKLLRLMLVSGGHDAVEAADGAEALMTLRSGGFDAVISDVLMPGMDGYRLCQEIRRSGGKLAEIPFIFYTSTYTSPSDEKLALSVGADKFLAKPSSAEVILAALEEAKAAPHSRVPAANPLRELEVLKEYSEALVRKLEHKNEELEASERRYREIVSLAPIGIYRTTRSGRFVSANAAFARLLGYETTEEVLALDLLRDVYADPSDRERALSEIEKANGMSSFEVRFKRRDGSPIWVNVCARPIVGESGSAEHFEGFIYDIDERKRAEESVPKLLHAVEQANNVILMTDPTGAITYVNPAFEKVYGYSREDALGKTPRILKSGRHDRTYYTQFWQRLRAKESIREEFVNRRSDGQLVTVENYVSPVLDSQSQCIGFIAVQNDITDRKRIEEALRESEKRFSLAFHASPNPTIISEIETGRILDVNEEFVRVSGHSRAQAIGKTGIELALWANPADRERVAARVLREGHASEGEMRIRTRSGEIRDVVGSAARIDVGDLTCLLTTFHDVTDRKRAESAMRRSEERFQRLFDSNTIGIAVANITGETIEANDFYLSLLGYTRDELVSGAVQWDQLTPPEYRKRDGVAIEQLQRTGVATPWEKELLRKDGKRVPILIGAAMLGESEGRCLAYVVDLTDRRRAEESVRASEERYRLLFDSNPQPMWVFDEKTLAFLAVNAAACRHYGYSPEEFRNMTILDIRPAADAPALRRLLSSEPREHPDSGIWKHRKKDGKLIEVETRSNPIVLDGREARLVLATDVTERRLLENQFRQAQKMEAVGQLAGGVAHDFNNLLTVILGFADLLASEIGSSNPLQEPIGQIHKAGERAASLTRQLLAFSRKQVLEPKVLDLNALVRDLERMLQRLIGEDVELVSNLGEIGRIRADAGQIEQVILNLAVNARDAMPRGGQLTIETRNVELDSGFAREHVAVPPGTYAMLAVSDTGTGMTADVKSHLFEPFFTTKERGKGTGLGLATVYGIVKQSEGTIWVYSEPDQGTTFKVYLPVVVGAPDEEAAPSPGLLATAGSETVLLVEDEQAVRTLTRRILERAGYTVLEANNGDAAVEVAKRHAERIHLLLTDVVMPGLNGSDLSSRIMAIRPDIRVLYMSGYTDDAVVRHGILAQGVHFLQKPFTPLALKKKVREVLDRKTPDAPS